MHTTNETFVVWFLNYIPTERGREKIDRWREWRKRERTCVVVLCGSLLSAIKAIKAWVSVRLAVQYNTI